MTPAPKSSELPSTHTGDPMLDSLNSFRRDILTDHTAQILLGACVAWPNAANGLTVTLNPGVASFKKSSGKKINYYVFESPDSRTASGLIEMNGLAVSDPQALTMVRPLEGIEGGLQRKLAPKVVTDQNGQMHYEDLQSSQPVLNTALVSGPMTAEHAVNVCLALERQESLPGQQVAPTA